MKHQTTCYSRALNLTWQRTHTSNGQITPLILGGDVTRTLQPVITVMLSHGLSELDRHFGANGFLGGFSEIPTGESLSNGTRKLALREFGHVYFARVWRKSLSVQRPLIRNILGLRILSVKRPIMIGPF